MPPSAVSRATPLNLAPRLVRRLATLDGADPRAIVEALTLWPIGARMSLVAWEIIDYDLGQDAAELGLSTQEIEEAIRRGEPYDFGVTEHGLDVIADCAAWTNEQRSEDADPNEWSDEIASSAELAGGLTTEPEAHD